MQGYPSRGFPQKKGVVNRPARVFYGSGNSLLSAGWASYFASLLPQHEHASLGLHELAVLGDLGELLPALLGVVAGADVHHVGALLVLEDGLVGGEAGEHLVVLGAGLGHGTVTLSPEGERRRKPALQA